jgi:hydroxymethylglutaryl-CoA lyase
MWRQDREATMNHPKRVRLVEVGPRDGLQNEAKPVSVEAKVALIDALSAAGHSAVEAGSFVSPKWVPQMANTDQVMARIQRKAGVSYPVLVPNKQGMNGAVEAGVGEIAIFTAASEAFCGDGSRAEARHESARLRLDRDRLSL